jgi:hypothetical protein
MISAKGESDEDHDNRFALGLQFAVQHVRYLLGGGVWKELVVACFKRRHSFHIPVPRPGGSNWVRRGVAVSTWEVSGSVLSADAGSDSGFMTFLSPSKQILL